MAIQPTNQEFIIRLLADYTASTLAELDANLNPYVGSYVHVLENDKIYVIESINGTPQRCEAVDSSNYITSPTDLATETTLSELVARIGEDVENPDAYSIQWRLKALKTCLDAGFQGKSNLDLLNAIQTFAQANSNSFTASDTNNDENTTAIVDAIDGINNENNFVELLSRIRAGKISYSNTSTTPPTVANPYVGDWELDEFFPNVMVTMATNVVGTLFIEFFDNDGVTVPDINTVPTSRFPVTGFQYNGSGFNEFHQSVKGIRWVRVRFVPETDATEFRINTYFVVKSEGNLPINQEIQSDQDSIITRSIIEGNQLDDQLETTDTYNQVGLLPGSKLSVGLAPTTLVEEFINIPSGSSVVIDPVFNTEANVWDSGWLPSAAYHSQLFHAKLNGATSVFLLNAPDVSGTNFTGGNFPFAITGTNQPTSGGSMFFQRYFRIVIVNTSGSTVSGHVESNGFFTALGSVLVPIEQTLQGFFPAPVTRAISAGKDPNGTYSNIELPGFYDAQSTIGGRPAGVPYEPTEWSRVNGYGSHQFAILGNKVIDETYYTDAAGDSAAFLIEVSADGVNKTTDFAIQIGTNPPAEFALFTFAFPYFRVKVAPAAEDEQFFLVNTIAYSGPPTPPIRSIDSPFTGRGLALTTRSVIFGRQPDGTFVPSPSDGSAFVYNTFDSDPIPLGDSEIETDWFETDGFKEIVVGLSTDVAATISVEFTIDANAETPIMVGQPLTFEYDQASINAGQLIEKFSPEYDGCRIRIEFLETAPSFVVSSVEFKNSPTALPQSAYSSNLEISERAVQTRGAIVAPNAANQLENIGRAGEGEGLNVHIIEDDSQTEISTNNRKRTGQLNITPDEAVQIPPPPFPNAKTVSISNTSYAVDVFWGDENVTATNGDIIFPRSPKDIDIEGDGSPYVIAGGSSGASETVNLLATNVASNTGVTDPNNILQIDNLRAVFDSIGDTLTVDGIDATNNITLPDIQRVEILLKARRASGSLVVNPTFQSATDGPQNGYPNSTTATINNIPLNSNGLYMVHFACRDENSDILSVSSNMGFSGYEIIGDTGTASNESRTAVVRMLGTPTSAGSITITVDTGYDHAAATCMIVTGFNEDTPLTPSDTFSSDGSSTYSGTVTGTQSGGLFVAAIGSEITTHSDMANPPNSTQRSDTGSTAGNDQSLHLRTAPITASGDVSYNGTMSGVSDVTVVAYTINPGFASNPTVEVIHSEGNTKLTQTLSNVVDDTFSVDITEDTVWTPAKLGGTSLTVNVVDINGIPIQIDNVRLQVRASSNITTVTYAWVGMDN